MKEEYAPAFRRFFRLRDLLIRDDPENVFYGLATLASWRGLQRSTPSIEHDKLLKYYQDDVTFSIALPMFLAPIDKQFFDLAKRASAATLLKRNRLAPGLAEIAAVLLVSETPSGLRHVVARDALIVMGLCVGEEIGWIATENDEKKPEKAGSSGGARFRQKMREVFPAGAPEPESIRKIWSNKNARLVAAGFSEQEACEFLGGAFPMKETGG